jgi:lipopolysaccharide transport system ATP-binding protein
MISSKQSNVSTMPDDVVIAVKQISKKFCRHLKRSMAYGIADLSKNLLGLKPNTTNLRQGEFWALQNVSFELRKGDTLGIIGVNGSGKTTLLRLLTGIFPPDMGEMLVKGRIGALVAVGAGFHPHMTGRENIYLNGTILGMHRKEIDAKFASISAFAEIGEFLDAPVSTYSSGMRVRLGFAIAIHCEPDILLVDEVLSVGDLAFRNKSLRRMNEFREKANALIFVSHNLEQVRVLCSRLIILDHGTIIYAGSTYEGIAQYEEMSRELRLQAISAEKSGSEIKIISTLGDYENDFVKILDVGILAPTGNKTQEINPQDPLQVYSDFSVSQPIEGLFFTIAIVDEKWTTNIIRLVSDDNAKANFSNLQPGTYRLRVCIKEHHLVPGIYLPHIAVRNSITNETYARTKTEDCFMVRNHGVIAEGRGLINVNEDWEIEKIN